MRHLSVCLGRLPGRPRQSLVTSLPRTRTSTPLCAAPVPSLVPVSRVGQARPALLLPAKDAAARRATAETLVSDEDAA